MAVPKRKTSRAVRDMRRATHAISAPTRSFCPQCREPKLPHHVCGSCGYYDGREVVQTD